MTLFGTSSWAGVPWPVLRLELRLIFVIGRLNVEMLVGKVELFIGGEGG